MLTIWNILLVYCIHYIAERFIQEFEDNKGRLSETVNKKTCSDQKVNWQKDNNEWTPRSTGSELKITGRVSKSWYGVYTVVFYNNKSRKKKEKKGQKQKQKTNLKKKTKDEKKTKQKKGEELNGQEFYWCWNCHSYLIVERIMIIKLWKCLSES